ncbi:MAG: biosis protein MshK [Betaproteobacteria bacterium]|jgi:MSHA biogenesis protein MshK|nr:biosis protein MshK [Betaproteobacteria bacterium]
MNRFITLLAALLLPFAVQAAPFADPTQPPTVRSAAEGSEVPSGPRIESILIAPDRRLAVINGQQVTIGSRVGSAAVVRITETEVVLRGAEGEQTLKLFPEFAGRTAAAAKKGMSK